LVRSRFLDQESPFFAVRKALLEFYGFDLVLEWICRVNKIHVLSHFGFLRPRSKIKTIGWIYDFQHKHLPEYFSAQELRNRDLQFAKLCRYCDRIVVSSKDARKDLASFFPEGLAKARVLRFVGATNATEDLPALRDLRVRYQLPQKFFVLPNQFWIHKNHRIVLEALVVLRDRGQIHYVVSTGLPNDPRDPKYYAQFLGDIQRLGLDRQFLILGMIPHKDVLSMIRNSVALINPSFFEGWSTSVEEGKSLGKRVLLSSIGVHLEQSPDRGYFFDPRDSCALADLMSKIWDEYDPLVEDAESLCAMQRVRERLLEFGRIYQEIALEAATGNQ
jgi:glycosyltransferase involved in cell wall biosynthesis